MPLEVALGGRACFELGVRGELGVIRPKAASLRDELSQERVLLGSARFKRHPGCSVDLLLPQWLGWQRVFDEASPISSAVLEGLVGLERLSLGAVVISGTQFLLHVVPLASGLTLEPCIGWFVVRFGLEHFSTLDLVLGEVGQVGALLGEASGPAQDVR